MVKAGDARVAMIGFPSVGKSTLLGKLTQTASAMGAYEFTTLTCIPGNIEYRDARIQLLDLPGIIEGASGGTFVVRHLMFDHFLACRSYSIILPSPPRVRAQTGRLGTARFKLEPGSVEAIVVGRKC